MTKLIAYLFLSVAISAATTLTILSVVEPRHAQANTVITSPAPRGPLVVPFVSGTVN